MLREIVLSSYQRVSLAAEGAIAFCVICCMRLSSGLRMHFNSRYLKRIPQRRHLSSSTCSGFQRARHRPGDH